MGLNLKNIQLLFGGLACGGAFMSIGVLVLKFFA